MQLFNYVIIDVLPSPDIVEGPGEREIDFFPLSVAVHITACVLTGYSLVKGSRLYTFFPVPSANVLSMGFTAKVTGSKNFP